jgi:hypothetical protein
VIEKESQSQQSGFVAAAAAEREDIKKPGAAERLALSPGPHAHKKWAYRR